MTAERFQQALSAGRAAEALHQFVPRRGDCLFLEAGTVHAIGSELLVFEVQQTSDITYRLFDWNRIDAKTGAPRQLHISDGLAASNFASGPCKPVTPAKDGEIETLVDCKYFHLERATIRRPWKLRGGACRIVTVIAGRGVFDEQPMTVGDTFLLPACQPAASIVPTGELVLLVSTPRAAS
jgi:mannose-6-phosphate isomerase